MGSSYTEDDQLPMIKVEGCIIGVNLSKPHIDMKSNEMYILCISILYVLPRGPGVKFSTIDDLVHDMLCSRTKPSQGVAATLIMCTKILCFNANTFMHYQFRNHETVLREPIAMPKLLN